MLDIFDNEVDDTGSAYYYYKWPRNVIGAPRRAAWQLKFALRNSISAAPRTKFLHIFFTIILGDFLFMNNNS